MTLTPCDFALAAIAAPEPESRLTRRITLAPLVIACSACCCCVDLSPSALSIVDWTPAASKACLSSGRSSVSQRTDDFESGSRTATLPGLAPPPPPPPPPLLDDESSPPQPATASAAPAAIVAANQVPLCTGVLLMGWWVLSLGVIASRRERWDAAGGRARPPRAPARWRRAPRRGRRASRRRRWRPRPPWAGPRARATPARRRAAALPHRRGRRRRSAARG